MLARALLLVSTLLVAVPAAAQLPDPVRAGLRAAGIPEEAMGALVVRLADGERVVAHRERQAMPPASTMKLVTSLAALEILGPAYRARTQLLASAEVVDGLLQGDLVLRGGGDVDFDWKALERMLSRLRLLGIREIRGDLVVDLSFFSPPRLDVGLAPFDESPEFRYNVVPDALLLNTYLVDLDISSHGGAVHIAPTPALAGVTFVSELELIDRACVDWEDGWKLPAVEEDRRGAIRVRLRGNFPRDCLASTALNVLDRVKYVDRLFRATWTRLGGTLRGRAREGAARPEARVLVEHQSRSLAEHLRDVNKSSDNPITRVMYLTLGANSRSESGGPTAKRAEESVRAWLEKRGIAVSDLVLDNGSGLSRTERIRPVDLAAVLRAATTSPWGPEYFASLPIVAVDGTMRRRLTGTNAAARARIKTGTLRDVSAVAGFVDDASGRPHIVVAMIHHDLANRRVARPILDSLLEWVASRQ